MSDDQNGTNPSNGLNPEDFEAFLRDFMSGQSGLDPAQLAAAAGLPNDPEALKQLIEQLRGALGGMNSTSGETGVNWELATNQAKAIAKSESLAILDSTRKAIADAVSIGALWLNVQHPFLNSLPNRSCLVERCGWPMRCHCSKPLLNRWPTA